MNQIGKVFDQTVVVVFVVNQLQVINFIPRLPIFCVIYRQQLTLLQLKNIDKTVIFSRQGIDVKGIGITFELRCSRWMLFLCDLGLVAFATNENNAAAIQLKAENVPSVNNI